ncbi:MAG TPA: hypothetical protein EYP33_03265, partial [Pyrodictium sp.]|nr:hypothetical protein [Pyrodictium sp.]
MRVFVNDNGIGVSKALYKVIPSTDSCPSDVTQYYTLPEGGEVVISDEGEWRVCIYAEDLLGNNKIDKSDVIRIDKT